MKPNDQVESNFNVNRDSASSLFAIVPTQLHEFVNFLICIQKINRPLESMLLTLVMTALLAFLSLLTVAAVGVASIGTACTACLWEDYAEPTAK
jgi:hypothetical protein